MDDLILNSTIWWTDVFRLHHGFLFFFYWDILIHLMTSNIYRLGQRRCTGVKMYINPLFPSLFWMKCGCAVKVETLKMWLNDQCNIKATKRNTFFFHGGSIWLLDWANCRKGGYSSNVARGGEGGGILPIIGNISIMPYQGFALAQTGPQKFKKGTQYLVKGWPKWDLWGVEKHIKEKKGPWIEKRPNFRKKVP